MADDDSSSYAPRSPDLAGYHFESPPNIPDSSSMFDHSSHSFPIHRPSVSSTVPPPRHDSLTSNPTTRQRRSHTDVDDEKGSGSKAQSGRKSKKVKVEVDYGTKPAPGVEEGIEVKTKFPVARIKRIMQADEDVGKVSQVTPTAVCTSILFPKSPR